MRSHNLPRPMPSAGCRLPFATLSPLSSMLSMVVIVVVVRRRRRRCAQLSLRGPQAHFLSLSLSHAVRHVCSQFDQTHGAEVSSDVVPPRRKQKRRHRRRINWRTVSGFLRSNWLVNPCAKPRANSMPNAKQKQYGDYMCQRIHRVAERMSNCWRPWIVCGETALSGLRDEDFDMYYETDKLSMHGNACSRPLRPKLLLNINPHRSLINLIQSAPNVKCKMICVTCKRLFHIQLNLTNSTHSSWQRTFTRHNNHVVWDVTELTHNHGTQKQWHV